MGDSLFWGRADRPGVGMRREGQGAASQGLSSGGGLCCLRSASARTVGVSGLTALTVSADPPPLGRWRPLCAHPLDCGTVGRSWGSREGPG